MATNPETNRDYESIERPYDPLLQRSENITNSESTTEQNESTDSDASQPSTSGGDTAASSNGSVETMPVKDAGSMDDIWINKFIRSKNWKPKKVGFYIDGRTGYAEFTGVYISGTITATSGIIGGFTLTPTKMYGGIIQTAETVGSGSTGVIMDTDGLRGYDSVLGLTFNLPTDGSAPTFSSGIINETIYEISTNAVLRTSSTVGDGSASSAGILINNTGFYACEANQTTANANVKILIDGSASFSGTITAASGTIGGWIIGANTLTGGGVTLNSSAGSISGATITGSTLTTATSGQRVELTSNAIFFYNTSGNVIGTIIGDSTTLFLGTVANDDDMLFNVKGTGQIVLSVDSSPIFLISKTLHAFYPASTTYDLGLNTNHFGELFVNSITLNAETAITSWPSSGGVSSVTASSPLSSSGGTTPNITINTSTFAMLTGATFTGDVSVGANTFRSGGYHYLNSGDNNAWIYSAGGNVQIGTSGGIYLIVSPTSLSCAGALRIDNLQVVSTRKAAITNPTGGATIDSEARTAINTILSRLESHGLIYP